MIHCALLFDGTESNLKTYELIGDENAIRNSRIDGFITKNSKNFFTKMGLNMNFLNYNPDVWKNLECYKESLEVVKSLQVVNDRDERSVSLIKEYNLFGSRNEEQIQAICQSVNVLRKFSPGFTKENLSKSFENHIFGIN